MLAQLAQYTRSPHQTIGRLDSGQIFALESREAPQSGRCIATQRAGAFAPETSSAAEGATRKPEPDTEASPAPDKLTYVMKNFNTKEILMKTMLAVKRLGGNAVAVEILAQTTGARKDL